MVDRGPNVSGRSIALILMTLIILNLPAPFVTSEDANPDRYSDLVKFDLYSTGASSDGVSGFNGLVVGRVNHTTSIFTRLENTNNVPLKDVEVTCTIYWYDGFYPDRGQIMFKDIKLVDVPPGDGEFSEMLEFFWVPQFAGAYIINLSAHVPGDARPMSTDPPFFQGIRYEPLPGKYFYSGVWVATEYWDGSEMDGWTSVSLGAPPEEGWRSVVHPLSAAPSLQHSYPECFYAGNGTTWNASASGTHSLISPLLDLKRFDPEPYDVERSIRRPQIFLLFRYRGNLSSSGPAGDGSMDLRISMDNGTTWEPLLDARDEPVSITGNTTTGTWDYAKRAFYVGTGHMVGLDLGRYQGQDVRIRFDETSSGVNETGYLLDDITLMGMDLVESVPFSVEARTGDVAQVEPGTDVEFLMDLHPKRTLEEVDVRFQCINASGSISVDEDVEIDPEILHLDGSDLSVRNITVTLSIPDNEISGDGMILIRAIGGGIARDVTFNFFVVPRHLVESRLIGSSEGEIGEGKRSELDLELRNGGNVAEQVHHAFVSETDLEWTGGRGKVHLGPGETVVLDGWIKVPNGSLSGAKIGYIVTSRVSLPDDGDLLAAIVSGGVDQSWTVMKLNFTVRTFRSVELITINALRTIEDPPPNGTMSMSYHLYLFNHGNGEDNISIQVSGIQGIGGMELSFPPYMVLGPVSSELLEVVLTLSFPVPLGRFNFGVTARSMQDGKVLSEDSAQLELIVGSEPISGGTFLNGTIHFQPEEVISGMETVIVFSTLTFGFPSGDSFEVGLLVDDVEVKAKEIPYILGEWLEQQISWTFTTPGEHNVTLIIYPSDGTGFPEKGLFRSVRSNVTVRTINIGIISMDILSDEWNGTYVEPGTHQIEVLVRNSGDASASVVGFSLEIVDLGPSLNATTYLLNLTDLGPGENHTILFKPFRFRASHRYRLTVSVNTKEKWLEVDQSDDVVSKIVLVGEEPPGEPVWRSGVFLIVVTGAVMLLSSALFIYLLRKKL